MIYKNMHKYKKTRVDVSFMHCGTNYIAPNGAMRLVPQQPKKI